MIVFGMKVLQKVATTPMRKSAREPEACFFAYAARDGAVGIWDEVHGGRALSRGVLQKCVQETCGRCGL